uniref:RWD domain-containing protein 1 n=1 Tax=Eptatretus burgeri TaxID=7764 RepID=A0A8C4QT05_EPTBU
MAKKKKNSEEEEEKGGNFEKRRRRGIGYYCVAGGNLKCALHAHSNKIMGIAMNTSTRKAFYSSALEQRAHGFWCSPGTKMTDYVEEQTNEFEALQSIYSDCFSVISEEPTSFTIEVSSDLSHKSGEVLKVELKFTFVERYPDEPPLFEVVSRGNLSDDDVCSLKSLLNEQAEENVGMVMIFTLVSAAQEHLNELVDQIKSQKDKEVERKQLEQEEADNERFQGTPVTIENFLAWKIAFNLEYAEMRSKKYQRDDELGGKCKLTGKQLFERDRNLDTSDMQFLEEGDNVEVDESLFQDLDDLALEDDENADLNPADLDDYD